MPEEDIEISIIDKTADFVAKLGADFEKRINENEKNNPKFAFLRGGEYHVYYKQKVNEFRAKYGKPVEPIPELKKEKEEEIKQEPQGIQENTLIKEESNNNGYLFDLSHWLPAPPVEGKEVEEAVAGVPEKQEESVSSAAKTGPTFLAQRMISTVRNYLKDHNELEPPPLKQFTITYPQDILSIDTDIIKLTAQFVARNGHQFQIGLMNREHKNPQFDFLKQGHPHHSYFLGLVEGYTRCLLPPKGLIEKLKLEFSDTQTLLDRLILRYEYEKRDRSRKAVEEAAQQDSQLSSQIDWYDFVIVECIDLLDEEPIPIPAPPPPPPKPEEKEAEMETEEPFEMEVEKPPTEMKIRKDYVKPVNRIAVEMKFQLCPKCGQQIPVDQIAEHMRIELLDPKFQNQRAQMQDRARSAMATTDENISSNLRAFAQRRTDIFGEEEVEIGKSVLPENSGSSKEDSKVIWDGHSGSLSRPGALGKSLDDQIAAIHQAKGLTKEDQPAETAPPPPPPTTVKPAVPTTPVTTGTYSAPPVLAQPFVPPPPRPAPPAFPAYPFIPPPSEPALKKQKVEEIQLMPEEEFLSAHKDNPRVKIEIQIPKEEKAEWKLEGQSIILECNLTEKISILKDKIKDETGMPPNKQKLKTPGIPILKDTASLAFYNMTDGSIVMLAVKERGGRGKK